MLTGNLVRVRYARSRIVPSYIDPGEARWQVAAEQLLELYRGQNGRTRGELEKDVEEAFGSDAGAIVYRGLAKLLEDRCEFEVVSGQPPERIREVVFRLAARERLAAGSALPCTQGRGFVGEGLGSAPSPQPLSPEYRGEGETVSTHIAALGAAPQREAVLRLAAIELEMTPESVEQSLFADLKSEQRLTKFDDTTAERLIHRYNVALAQAVLMRSTRVEVAIHKEKPARYRQLLRAVKFHRLICDITCTGPESSRLVLDGPLSLFTATQKYGVQLANFLPTLLLCREFELDAELRWGPERRPKSFRLCSDDGLVTHSADIGTYVPPELAMFVELFRKRIEDWEISEETEVFPLGDGFWVPDYRLSPRGGGKTVLMEVLGFWRRASAERHLQRLRQSAPMPFLLAVSDQLHIDDAALENLPAGIHRFRQMPLPDEIARLARELT
jgi:predicted nuclease of restriction endonuclease-like RecB superfamily